MKHSSESLSIHRINLIQKHWREQKPFIKIWRFEDAPVKYKNLSNSGDEDYVMWVPMINDSIDYLQSLGLFRGANDEGVSCHLNFIDSERAVIFIGYSLT